jgi:hypothetical protein
MSRAPSGRCSAFWDGTNNGHAGRQGKFCGGGEATGVVSFDDPSATVWRTDFGSDDFYLVFSEYESDIWVMDL